MSSPQDPKSVALQAREVSWDWTGLPKYYAADDGFATHYVNTFNMLLPEGEIFFVESFKAALPMITDDAVREDVVGFIGQEAMHSTAHQTLLDHCTTEQGLSTEVFVEQVRYLFRSVLGDRDLEPAAQQRWTTSRVATVAALEHFTSYLGNWGLNAKAWPGNIEPRVLDLLLWHLAEEVEHRHVAFDLFTHLDGRYRARVRSYFLAMPMFLILLVRGTRHLAKQDPEMKSGPIHLLVAARRAWKRGLIPGPGSMLKMFFDYLRPGYHPSQYGSTTQAVAYLSTSPAARAAH